MRAFMGCTVFRKVRCIYNKEKSRNYPCNKTAAQERERLTKEDLAYANETHCQVRPDQYELSSVAVNTHSCWKDSDGSSQRSYKEHQANKIGAIAKGDQVEIIEDQQDTEGDATERIADEIESGVALKTPELA